MFDIHDYKTPVSCAAAKDFDDLICSMWEALAEMIDDANTYMFTPCTTDPSEVPEEYRNRPVMKFNYYKVKSHLITMGWFQMALTEWCKRVTNSDPSDISTRNQIHSSLDSTVRPSRFERSFAQNVIDGNYRAMWDRDIISSIVCTGIVTI